MLTFLKLGKIFFLILIVGQLHAQRMFIVADTFNFSKKSYLKANNISYKNIYTYKEITNKLVEFPQSASLAIKRNNTFFQGYALYFAGFALYNLIQKNNRINYSYNNQTKELLSAIPLVLGGSAGFVFIFRSFNLHKKALKIYNFYKNNPTATK